MLLAEAALVREPLHDRYAAHHVHVGIVFVFDDEPLRLRQRVFRDPRAATRRCAELVHARRESIAGRAGAVSGLPHVVLDQSHLAFKQWGSVFHDASCLGALVDRFAQHCHIIDIDADSWRKKEAALKRGKNRKDKDDD